MGQLKVGARGKRTRGPPSRPRGALREIVDAMVRNPKSQTILEHAAVSERVRQNYARRLEDFQAFLKKERLPHHLDEDMDSALVIFFNQKYLEGEGAHVGDYTLAAIMDANPSFGRQGHRHLPRAWRSLKGWRKLCPARSRLAFPLAVWCAISWRMVQRGHLQKAIFNLMQVSTYHRPGALLQLRKLGLARPTSGITRHWSVVTSLTETDDISKTGTKDDSIVLDSKWITFMGPILEQLKKGKPLDRVWNFNYAEYLSVFRSCCKDLRIDLVPYQARHSGHSIDRASNVRTQEEVRKRGGWMARQSVARYEKAGRLAATWQKLDSATQLTCKAAEANIEAIILGQHYPNIALP